MQDAARGVPVSQAAAVLGISVAAARKRVQRGSLRAYKVDGQWMVVLPMGSEVGQDVGRTIALGRGQDAGADSRDALIAHLQVENARLWDLVARLAGERAPALPAPSSGPPSGVEVSAEPPQEATHPAPRPPWWKRWARR